MPQEKDYIGFDPVAWIERLREVNRGSQFPDHAKKEIETAFRQLQEYLAANPDEN